MEYQSTRDASHRATSAQAVLRGLAEDGGLYTPASLRGIDFDWRALMSLEVRGMAARILSALLPDFGAEEAERLVRAGYAGKFDADDLTPTVPVGEDYVLELFHGPTAAFKDVALSMLPLLMSAAREKCAVADDILILTATSGDTGKAAMEGFRDVPGTRILVFYPDGGVSPVQRAQMVTQEGGNVCVCAVRGNFDDAQAGVKRIFAEVEREGLLRGSGVRLSSANSINIGRLVPQVVYYFKAYADLVRMGRITMGEAVDFVVPTGNFGDILAGYFARELGLPVGTLVCASNGNSVLTDFLRTGRYDRHRPFYKTLSPSMDILVSSNLERLLFLLSGDEELVRTLMRRLAEEGYYDVPPALFDRIRALFRAGCCSDEQTLRTIADVWQRHGYLCDTHTAVAWEAARQYKASRTSQAPVVVLSTASPYKFPAAVLSAVGGGAEGDEFEMMERLHALTGVPIPENLRGLRARPVRHRDVIAPEEMLDYVLGKALRWEGEA